MTQTKVQTAMLVLIALLLVGIIAEGVWKDTKYAKPEPSKTISLPAVASTKPLDAATSSATPLASSSARKVVK